MSVVPTDPLHVDVVPASGENNAAEEHEDSGDDLQTTTDQIDINFLYKEKKKKEKNAEEDNEARDSDEERRGLKGWSQDRAEVLEISTADLLMAGVDELTDVVESHPARARTVVRVSDPLRLSEDDDVDNEEAAGEDGPGDAHGVRVMHVALVVATSLCLSHDLLHGVCVCASAGVQCEEILTYINMSVKSAMSSLIS